MSQQPPLKTFKFLPHCEPQAMDQVLDILERWRQRTENHFSNSRREHRFPYPRRALLVCHERIGSDTSRQLASIVLEVQTRNLSCGGLSLLAAPVYVPEQSSDSTPAERLHVERILSVGRKVSIGLPRPGSDLLWMRGAIVRSRMVHFGFRECGVSFLARYTPQEGECTDVLTT